MTLADKRPSRDSLQAQMHQHLILHVDLDAFFCSVEVRDNPRLQGKPVIVGGSVERGVVSAASYEARKYGVFSAMPMAKALRLCPHAIVVAHHMERYVLASEDFFKILDDYSPLVEGLSLDEAFMDISGTARLLGQPIDIARSIKARVRKEIGLVASVGIAPSKFIAKIASDIRKPDGICIVKENEVLAFLHPLPISRLWGVGKVGQAKLSSIGLSTIGDVAAFPSYILQKKMGKNLGAHIAALAQGHDTRCVERRSGAVTIGHEETFEKDVWDLEQIRRTLLGQADKVARRLRKRDLRAKTIVLKIKFADFNQITRRKTLSEGTSDASYLCKAVYQLLAKVPIDCSAGKSSQVRLCGMSVTNLEPESASRQLGFEEEEREKGGRLGKALDALQDRFGESIVQRASLQKEDGST